MGNDWSGRRESNPPQKLGRLLHYHYATPALQSMAFPNADPDAKQETVLAEKLQMIS
ncbi:hypothetical protein AA102526_2303 [Asaia lannensis NBRC 102526]|nr:hypothetical protein AA102526_2303 [Asaia lannensis NBRC 102526]